MVIGQISTIDVWKNSAQHLNSHGHSLEDLSVFRIEKIHREEVPFCKANESHWIRTLSLLALGRLNLEP